MNLFLDTTAIIKLIVDESGSDIAAETWDAAEDVSACLLAYPESCAALAAARRGRRLTPARYGQAKVSFEQLWKTIFVVGVDEDAARRAGDLAESHGLRGYDAVHLASALALDDDQIVIATWDVDLWKAARREHLAVTPFEVPAGR